MVSFFPRYFMAILFFMSQMFWKALIVIPFIPVLLCPLHANSQKDKDFIPNGKPVIQVFSGLRTSFSNGENEKRVEITRAFLGYSYNFTPLFSGRITFDVGNPSMGNFKSASFLKFAYIQYDHNKLSVRGGMIPTLQFDIFEKKWGYRYVCKSFQDEYGLVPSTDIGVNVVYTFNRRISADVILVNGEGNKYEEKDSVFRAGTGISFTLQEGLLVRGYYDRMKKGIVNQQGYALLVSYNRERYNLKAEYNYQQNHSLVAGHHYGGISFNGTLSLSRNLKLYARYDRLESVRVQTDVNRWNYVNDGELFIAGIEFSPAQSIRISPNFQGWQPAHRDTPFLSKVYLSLEIKI